MWFDGADACRNEKRMSDHQPRQVQCKLGDVDADGNWQLGSPAPASATDDKT